MRFDSASKIWRTSLRRPRVDESDETSDWSDWTVVQPGMSGRSDAFRCEVQRLRWAGFVFVRSQGTSASHSLTSSVGLCDTLISLTGRAGEQVGLSEHHAKRGIFSGVWQTSPRGCTEVRAFRGLDVCQISAKTSSCRGLTDICVDICLTSV